MVGCGLKVLTEGDRVAKWIRRPCLANVILEVVLDEEEWLTCPRPCSL